LSIFSRLTARLNISHCSGRILFLSITFRDPFPDQLYTRMSDLLAVGLAQGKIQFLELDQAPIARSNSLDHAARTNLSAIFLII
jgi:hypothetical protein